MKKNNKIYKNLNVFLEAKSTNTTKYQIKKSCNEELKQVLFIVMVPEEVDLHGDITSKEEVQKACHNFNTYCRKANLFHLAETDSFSIVESYISPVDFILGDKVIKSGTWLANLQIHSDDIWDLVKSGEICAVSIGAIADTEVLDND